MLILLRTGLLFLLSAAFHLLVWAADGMPSLEGPVSWRKPMTFGFSTGVLFLSLAWVMTLLPTSARRQRQARWFSALLIAEIALIDMQQWRGVASHFNSSTPFDAAVFTSMGVIITIASVFIALWTRDVFRERLSTTPALAFAVRAGMVMLNVGNAIGMVIAATQATALKPLHAIALHAIQSLPIAVLAISLIRSSREVGYARAWRDRSRFWRWHSLPHSHHP